MSNFKTRLADIQALIFDYDGVFTDGNVIVLPDGEFVRTAHVKDGYALQLAVRKGLRIAVISGGRSESVRKRFDVLGIKDVFLGANNKYEIYQDYIVKNNLKPEHILYMGDDIPDYRIMKEVSVAACPADAVPEIRTISHYISHLRGGMGCARDVIEQVLKVKGLWFDKEAFEW